MSESKICSTCGETKKIFQFRWTNSSRKESRHDICASCQDRSGQKTSYERRLAKGPKPVTVSVKICPDCRTSKLASEFSASIQSKDGLHYYCKSCTAERTKILAEKNKNQPDPEEPADGTRKCSRCQEIKPLTAFHRNRAAKGHRMNYCKECSTERMREVRLKTQYGMSRESYEALVDQQNGVCFLCKKAETLTIKGKDPKLIVDHCHASGKVSPFCVTAATWPSESWKTFYKQVCLYLPCSTFISTLLTTAFKIWLEKSLKKSISSQTKK